MDALGTVALYGTAWLALTCWAIFQWFPGWARLIWTIGCLANLVHILLAFHYIHAWDHELAYAAVATQTCEQTGFDTGVGIYINYFFSALWLGDAMSWWLFPHRYLRRPRWLDGVLQFFFLFMFFNATVVFGTTPARVFGAVLCPMGAIGWFLKPCSRIRENAG